MQLKNLLLTTLLLSTSAFLPCRAQDPVPLRNAYEIASALQKANHLADTSREKKRIISALIWYTGAENMTELLQEASPYKTLEASIKNIYNLFTKTDQLFTFSAEKLARLDSVYPQPEVHTLISALYSYQAVKKKRDGFAADTARLTDSIQQLADAVSVQRRDTMEIQLTRQSLNQQLRDLTMDTIALDSNEVVNKIAGIVTRLQSMSSLYSAHADTLKGLQEVLLAEKENKRNLSDSIAHYQATMIGYEAAIKKQVYKKELDYFRSKELLSPDLSNGNYIPTEFLELQQTAESLAENASAFQQQALLQIQGDLPSIRLGLPSEAEAIDALAIYLAKRVKQESVLWFFESLRKNAELYEVVNVCFPATMALLNSEEVYDVPNLGASWRYTLSKDFVELPEHMFASEWLRKRSFASPAVISDLQLATTIYRLIQQGYQYTDMVKYLYLSKPTSDVQGSLHTLTTLLYAFNHEFIVEDSGESATSSAHFLRFEELSNMPAETFFLMLQLADLRYDGIFERILGNIGVLSSKDKQRALMAWLGRIELAIAQFHMVKKQYEQQQRYHTSMNAQSGAEAAYTLFSTWKLTAELFEAMMPDSHLFQTQQFEERLRTSIWYVKKAQDIYEQLENRSFSGALISTLDIVDSLTSDKALMNKHAENKWRIPLYLANHHTELYEIGGSGDKVPQAGYRHYQALLPLLNATNKVIAENRALYGFLMQESDTLRNSDLLFIRKGNQIFRNGEKDEFAVQFHSDTIHLKYPLQEEILSNEKFYHTIRLMISAELQKNDPSSAAGDKQEQKEGYDYTGLMQYLSYFKNSRYDRAKKAVRDMAAFLDDVSRSGDSKQLAEVIESYAMPKGSYKRKRNVWYSLDLNAFVGPYTGLETLVGTGNNAEGVFGISAPIGVTWSKTLGRSNSRDTSDFTSDKYDKSSYNKFWQKSKSTFSFGVSIVDIGAVVSYRFSNSDGVLPQTVKWEQFISPGLHMAYGIPGTPLVWNFGLVYTPKLRKIEQPEIEQYNAYRVQSGVFFDIPLYNLWERKHIVRYKK